MCLSKLNLFSLSWNAFWLMKHLHVVASTSTSTFKFSIWAHIQQCPVPFKTVLKDIPWMLLKLSLGEIGEKWKFMFPVPVLLSCCTSPAKIEGTRWIFHIFFLRSSTINYLIWHVHNQSCIHVILQYHPISLQLPLNSQSHLDGVLFKHHWEFPVQRKTIPLLSCYSTSFLFSGWSIGHRVFLIQKSTAHIYKNV